MTSARLPLLAGAVAGAVAVALGAFGAHALRGMLDERALSTWHTAVDYQFWHALALLAVGLLTRATSTRASKVAAIAFVAGIVLFCGSLYALALGAPHLLGVITPVGGIAFIAGWIALAVHVSRDAATQ
ncbi:MAG TPA: DUF423 domain-containing protein [Dokdonella sp.]